MHHEAESMSDDLKDVRQHFSELARSLDYPLYIVTARAEEEHSGCLIGFATQCSVHPPRFLACLSIRNHTYGVARRAGWLGVHIVEKADKGLAEIFGGTTGDAVDKFATLRWRTVCGVPVLAECPRWFVGRVIDQFELGDHCGFLLEPVEAAAGGEPDQLTFQQARGIKAGHRT